MDPKALPIDEKKLVDPERITDYNLPLPRLEERLLFWISAVQNDAKSAARSLYRFLTAIKGHDQPFQAIEKHGFAGLAELMKRCGYGKATMKSKAFYEAATSGLDLRSCTLEELESIHGIGMKTSRCFIMHSRRGAAVSGLDTHILKALKTLGHDTPKGTPTRKAYLALEPIVISYARSLNLSAADHDLLWWNAYQKRLRPTKTQLLDKTWLLAQQE